MNVTKTLVYAVAMTTLAAITSTLWAAEPLAKGGAARAAKVQRDRLSIEQLGEMLDNLGFDPKPNKNDDGEVESYELEFQSGTWTLYHRVSLSRNRKMIWFNSNLITINRETAVSPEALLALLEDDAWPAYVYYSKKYKRLRLAMPVENKDVTPAELRKNIETFTDHVKTMIQSYQKASKLVKGE